MMKGAKLYRLADIWLLLPPVLMLSLLLGYLVGSSVKISSEIQSSRSNVASSWLNGNYKQQSTSKIHVASNPRGAEGLPPGIVESYSDFSFRGCVGNNDTVREPKYLLVLTVGIEQKDIVNKMVSKFSENFTIIVFHYDGKASEWDQYEWSQRAIHISALKQTKWWYAKRFLHSSIVAPYEYIFIWDEDLGVEHFNAEEYIKIVKEHDLEISQPGITSHKSLTWNLTQRRQDVEIHRRAEKQGSCVNSTLPPCAGFVEIMAPVFSRDSWNCVWHMIQNDLVHGWGIDFALWRCVKNRDENIGVVDAQWIEHLGVPSLRDQSLKQQRQSREGVRARCHYEWKEFTRRMKAAEKLALLSDVH